MPQPRQHRTVPATQYTQSPTAREKSELGMAARENEVLEHENKLSSSGETDEMGTSSDVHIAGQRVDTTNVDVAHDPAGSKQEGNDHDEQRTQPESENPEENEKKEIDASVDADNSSAPQVPKLSKNAQKRLIKKALVDERRKAKKLAIKEQKVAARMQAAAQGDGVQPEAKRQRTEEHQGAGEHKSSAGQKEREDFDVRRLSGQVVWRCVHLIFEFNLNPNLCSSLAARKRAKLCAPHRFGTVSKIAESEIMHTHAHQNKPRRPRTFTPARARFCTNGREHAREERAVSAPHAPSAPGARRLTPASTAAVRRARARERAFAREQAGLCARTNELPRAKTGGSPRAKSGGSPRAKSGRSPRANTSGRLRAHAPPRSGWPSTSTTTTS